MDVSEYMKFVYGQIGEAVALAQRDLRRGVLPRDVQPRLPYGRAEGSLRRDMLNMTRTGMLVRVGGYGARRGYRLPTPMERLSWMVNRGRWPVYTELAH